MTQPILKEPGFEVHENDRGLPVIVEANGQKKEFRTAEECWREIQRRRRAVP